MQEQRQQHGAAQQGEAEHEHQQVGDCEGALPEQVQVDNGVLVAPFPPHHKQQRRRRDHKEPSNKVGLEPVIALALVQHHLQASQPQGNKAQADVIDPGLAEFAAVQIRGVLDEAGSQQQRHDAYRDIDEENPAPGEIVGDPASQRRTDGRRHDHGDPIDGERHSSLGGQKCIGQDRLLAGLQAASSHALQNPENDQPLQIGSQSAQKRTQGKQEHASHVELFAAHDRRQPTA